MTMNVIKRMRLRYGKGCPSPMNNGMESAAARDTTPRIPAQPAINGDYQPGFASATVIKWLIKRVNRPAPNVQSMRAMINAEEIASPYQIALPKLMSPSWCIMEGNW